MSKIEKTAASCDGLILCNINFNDELIKNAKKIGKPVFTDLQDLSDIHDFYNRRFLQNADVIFLSDEKIQGNHEDFLLALHREYQNKIIVLGQGKKAQFFLPFSLKKHCVRLRKKRTHRNPMLCIACAGCLRFFLLTFSNSLAPFIFFFFVGNFFDFEIFCKK